MMEMRNTSLIDMVFARRSHLSTRDISLVILVIEIPLS